MSIVTMTSTVAELTSGQMYRVRAKTAERLIQQNKATLAAVKKIAANKEGKRDG